MSAQTHLVQVGQIEIRDTRSLMIFVAKINIVGRDD